VTTGVRWAKRLSPPGYSLVLLEAALVPGGTVAWGPDHGDEAVYVVTGEVEVDGRRCPAGGAVVVESGVSTVLRASRATRIVHCSPADPDPPTDGLNGPAAPDGHGVHVVGPAGWFRSGAKEGVVATWYADGSCPTCRIALFKVDHHGGMVGRLHSHSRDEIIFVLDGVVALGPRRQPAGTAICVPADVTYKTAYPVATTFLNFRADVAEQRNGRHGTPIVDGALARGGELVGDLR